SAPPPPESAYLQSEHDWRHLMLNAGVQHWHIQLSKKTKNSRKTVNYLGRYLKNHPSRAAD
ncbi:ISPsy3, transposase, partial [Pseudomonas syringae pv. actinidiae ICMP 19096]